MTEILELVDELAPQDSPEESFSSEAFGIAFEDAGSDGQDQEMAAANAPVIRQLVAQAKDAGMAITGPGGLLKQITKMVIESALDEETAEHLGYDKYAPEGRNSGNSRNGTRSKTVVTDNPRLHPQLE